MTTTTKTEVTEMISSFSLNEASGFFAKGDKFDQEFDTSNPQDKIKLAKILRGDPEYANYYVFNKKDPEYENELFKYKHSGNQNRSYYNRQQQQQSRSSYSRTSGSSSHNKTSGSSSHNKTSGSSSYGRTRGAQWKTSGFSSTPPPFKTPNNKEAMAIVTTSLILILLPGILSFISRKIGERRTSKRVEIIKEIASIKELQDKGKRKEAEAKINELKSKYKKLDTRAINTILKNIQVSKKNAQNLSYLKARRIHEQVEHPSCLNESIVMDNCLLG